MSENLTLISYNNFSMELQSVKLAVDKLTYLFLVNHSSKNKNTTNESDLNPTNI